MLFLFSFKDITESRGRSHLGDKKEGEPWLRDGDRFQGAVCAGGTWQRGSRFPAGSCLPLSTCARRGLRSSPCSVAPAAPQPPTNPACLVRCREAEEQEVGELTPAGSTEAGPDGAASAQQPVCPEGPRRDENQPCKDLGEPSASPGASQAGAVGRLAALQLSRDQPRSTARSRWDALPMHASRRPPQTPKCPPSPAAAS